MRLHPCVVRPLLLSAVAALLTVSPPGVRSAPPRPLHVLTVGGGPSARMNQVAIESNVRYLEKLLPARAEKTVLFADGNTATPTVAYLDPPTEPAPAETAFRFLYGEAAPRREKFRPTALTALDGPAQKARITTAIESLAAEKDGRYLLYFTGHGETAKDRNLDNNVFDLWGGETLSVQELAARLKALPADNPVVVVMVQCYSGAFGNLLFEDGNPQGAVLTRDFAGFFATVKERVAAGCTPEVNEAEYHDFTSYFFAALSGTDRLGRRVTGADYDRNGRVGMDEAFAYALIEGPSIDVPVATTDVFLRRFVPLPDETAAITPFSKVLAAASPAQKVVLERLSRHLGIEGEDRLQTALAEVRKGLPGSRRQTPLPEEAAALRRQWRADLQAKYAGLTANRRSAEYAGARRAAREHLASRPAGEIKPLLEAARELSARSEARYQEQIREARWLRLMRVAKSVVLEQRLRASGDRGLVGRFDRLRAAEARNPLTEGV